MDNTTAELQAVIGYPEYTLLDKGTELDPLHAWDAPHGAQQKFSAQDLYDIFHKECILFMGDSLQRRAADTLHVMIENRRNPNFFHDYSNSTKYTYFWKAKEGHGNYTRVIGSLPPTQYRNDCESGTIDSAWLPTHKSVATYKYKKPYDIIIVGNGPWDNVKGSFTPEQMRIKVNQSIYHLHKVVPENVLILWKTRPWGLRFNWNFLEEDKKSGAQGSNYLVHVSNQAAKASIETINADNLRFLDWGKEMLPYSFSERQATNMMAENMDHSSWHVGPKGRALLVQMIASEVHVRQMKHGGGNNSKSDTVIPEMAMYSKTEKRGYSFDSSLDDTRLHCLIGIYLVLLLMISKRKRLTTSRILAVRRCTIERETV